MIYRIHVFMLSIFFFSKIIFFRKLEFCKIRITFINHSMKTVAFTVITLSLIALSACTSTNANKTESAKQSKLTPQPSDYHAAKTWLEKAIPEYFNTGLNPIESITTGRYAEYKSDMINSVYDGLTFEELKVKWGSVYKVDEKKLGLGFLIGAQDWDTVQIDRCRFVKAPNDSTFIFEITLSDKATEKVYPSQVTVVRDNTSFAIDDVKEEY